MAPKKRANGLPPYVYKRKYGYQMRVYAGKGNKMSAVTLCPADAPISEVWRCYESHIKHTVKNLSWLFAEYKKSKEFLSKAATTQKYQTEMAKRICDYTMKNGKQFGSAELKMITPGGMRQYLDARDRDKSPKAGNREVALISVAWNWALERDLIDKPNPCSVVRKNKEESRTRYVTDAEYAVAYELAARYPYLQPAMEMAYLCRMRRIEVLNAKRSQILEQGFDTLRTKGSRSAITLWSDRLRAAVNYNAGDVKSMYIIHDKNGQKITEEAFKSAWTRLKKLLVDKGIEVFNYHDIKAKAVSDFDGDKLKASGHVDAKMLKVYDRKKHEIESTR